MRKTIVLIILLLFLAGCGGSEQQDAVPTRAESAAPGPRISIDTPTPGLPPTWTPSSATEGEHLPESSGTPISGENTGGVIIGPDSTTYVVERGDTLGEIAARFGVSISVLADANNITNWDVIEVGTVLVIPD